MYSMGINVKDLRAVKDSEGRIKEVFLKHYLSDGRIVEIPFDEESAGTRKVFNLFLDDPHSNTTSLESIKRVADEVGENIEELELNAMLNKASKAGARLTFDDFVAIMTGKENA